MTSKSLQISILVILFFSFCSTVKYETEPGIEGYYRLLTLKLNVKDSRQERRGSGKIILKFDDKYSKMLFLSPLNQVYYELHVEREEALLINPKRKKYWRGKFTFLLRELWGINFTYGELERLITDGIIPGRKVRKAALDISVVTDEETEKPVRITITGSDVLLRLKVLNKKLKQGRLKPDPRLAAFRSAHLEEVLTSGQ